MAYTKNKKYMSVYSTFIPVTYMVQYVYYVLCHNIHFIFYYGMIQHIQKSVLLYYSNLNNKRVCVVSWKGQYENIHPFCTVKTQWQLLKARLQSVFHRLIVYCFGFSDLQTGSNLCLKELPWFHLTTFKTRNSGGRFPDIYSCAISLEDAVPSFKSLFCLLNIEQTSSPKMWGYCCLCFLSVQSQPSKAMSGWTYKREWILYCNFQKIYGLF